MGHRKVLESETEEQAETDEDELGKSSLWTLLTCLCITSSTFAKGLAIEGVCLLSVRS